MTFLTARSRCSTWCLCKWARPSKKRRENWGNTKQHCWESFAGNDAARDIQYLCCWMSRAAVRDIQQQKYSFYLWRFAIKWLFDVFHPIPFPFSQFSNASRDSLSGEMGERRTMQHHRISHCRCSQWTLTKHLCRRAVRPSGRPFHWRISQRHICRITMMRPPPSQQGPNQKKKYLTKASSNIISTYIFCLWLNIKVRPNPIIHPTQRLSARRVSIIW